MKSFRKFGKDLALPITRKAFLLLALFASVAEPTLAQNAAPPAAPAAPGGAAGAAAGGSEEASASKGGAGTTNECQPINYLPGVTASTIGSVPALQTKLLAIYTDPVQYKAEESASTPSGYGLRGWTGVLGTNTIASNKDAGRMELLFRNSGAYNLYFSKVGYRESTKTKSGQPVPKAMEAVRAAHDNLTRPVAGTPPTVSDAVQRWVDIAKQKAADLSKSQTELADAKAEKKPDKDKLVELTTTVNDVSDQSKAASAAATAAIQASSQAGAKAADVDVAANATLQGQPPSIDCSDPVTVERINATDRNYWLPVVRRRALDEDKEQWRLFISNGLGVRALSGSGSNATTSGYGTFYLGIGLDKGGYSIFSQKSDGFFSGEIYLSATTINKRDLDKMFSITNAPGWFGTAGVEGRMALNQIFDVKIDYARGLGGFGRHPLGDMTAISLAVKTDQVLKSAGK